MDVMDVRVMKFTQNMTETVCKPLFIFKILQEETKRFLKCRGCMWIQYACVTSFLKLDERQMEMINQRRKSIRLFASVNGSILMGGLGQDEVGLLCVANVLDLHRPLWPTLHLHGPCWHCNSDLATSPWPVFTWMSMPQDFVNGGIQISDSLYSVPSHTPNCVSHDSYRTLMH